MADAQGVLSACPGPKSFCCEETAILGKGKPLSLRQLLGAWAFLSRLGDRHARGSAAELPEGLS